MTHEFKQIITHANDMDIAHGSSRMNTDYCELLRSRSSGMYTLGEAPTARAKQVRNQWQTSCQRVQSKLVWTMPSAAEVQRS